MPLITVDQELFTALVTELDTARALVSEAMAVHIYGDEDEPSADCNYAAFVDSSGLVLANAAEVLTRPVASERPGEVDRSTSGD